MRNYALDSREITYSVLVDGVSIKGAVTLKRAQELRDHGLDIRSPILTGEMRKTLQALRGLNAHEFAISTPVATY